MRVQCGISEPKHSEKDRHVEGGLVSCIRVLVGREIFHGSGEQAKDNRAQAGWRGTKLHFLDSLLISSVKRIHEVHCQLSM